MKRKIILRMDVYIESRGYDHELKKKKKWKRKKVKVRWGKKKMK